MLIRPAGSFSIFPPAFSTPPPAPGCVFPRSGCSSMTLRLLFRLSGSLSIFPLAFLLPPTGCSSLPPPLLSHPAGCFSIFPGAFPCSHLLCRLPGYFSIFLPGFPSPLPPSPAVCFFAFPAPPFPCTTTSCFSIFVATSLPFCLTFLFLSHNYTPWLLFHLCCYFPILSPPHPLHEQLFQAPGCSSIISVCFSTTSTSPAALSPPLLLFHLSNYFHIFLDVLPPTPTVAFPSLWVLFHPPSCFFHAPCHFSHPSFHLCSGQTSCCIISQPPPCLPSPPLDCPISSGRVLFPHFPDAPF